MIAEDKDKTVLQWYINGVRATYLDNLRRWNDIDNTNDPIYSHAFSFTPKDVPTNESVLSFARQKGESLLKPGDKVFFTVKPSDGQLYGSRSKSDSVLITEAPPSVASVKIVGLKDSGEISSSITSSDTAILKFDLLSDTDINNSEITWIVNDVDYKTGVLNIDNDIDRIKNTEFDKAGNLVLAINNSLSVRIVPQTAGATGDTITSEAVVIKNSPPSVKDVFVGPTNPRSTQNLILSYKFVDKDIDAGDSTQSDQSNIQWFFADATTNNVFEENVSLANTSKVPSEMLKINQKWKAVVTPFDALDKGLPQSSNIVTIR